MEEGLGMAEVKIRSDSSKRKRDQIMAAFDCAIGFVIIYIEEQLGDNLTWELATYTSRRRVEREFISLECTWWERNQSERRDWLESLSQFKTESGRFFIIFSSSLFTLPLLYLRFAPSHRPWPPSQSCIASLRARETFVFLI